MDRRTSNYQSIKMTLKKPYDHLVPIAEFRVMQDSIKSKLKEWDGKIKGTRLRMQCTLLNVKPVTYGRKVGMWMLGYKPGATGDESGVTKEEWDLACSTMTALIKSAVPEAIIHKQEWGSERKFQYRWDAYIMLEELQP